MSADVLLYDNQVVLLFLKPCLGKSWQVLALLYQESMYALVCMFHQ